MFTKLIQTNIPTNATPKEGDIYKVITVFGKTFELKYGYYSDSDRNYEPDILYPSFSDNPEYTDSGDPFVTAMQEPCEAFNGEKNEDSTCGDCSYYNKGMELIGICRCRKRK